MSFQRMAIHSLVLAAANLLAILAGFGLYTLLRPANQLMVQVPVAALLSVGAFLLWARFFPADWLYDDWRTFVGAYLAAFVWLVVLFVPLHALTQGYLTAGSNILSTWAFQAPVNALALWAGYRILQHRFWQLDGESG